MSDNRSLQENFLQILRTEKIPVSVFLVNGIKLHGLIDAFNDSVLMLKNTVTQMVFKHSVSTVVPSRMVETSEQEH